MNAKIKLSILGTLITTSTLVITLPIFSCSSSTSSDVDNNQLTVNDDIKKNVEKLVTESLRNKMQASGITRKKQIQLANSWIIGKQIPEEELNIFKEKLKFTDANGNDVKFVDAVKNVTFENETIIPKNGPINGPKLKVNFNEKYSGDVLIQTGILGNAIMAIELTLEDSVMQDVIDIVTKSLFYKMQAIGITNAQQVGIAKEWSVGNKIPKDELDLIRPILNFKDGDGDVLFDDAVESITITKGIELPSSGTIYGPELKINFNAEYFGEYFIQVGELGDLVPPIALTIDDSALQAVSDNVTKSLFDKLQSGEVTYYMQKEVSEEWQIDLEIPENELIIIKENLNFKDNDGNEILGIDAINSVVITKEMTIHDTKNSIIISPELKINFSAGYTGDVLIKVGNLGSSFFDAIWKVDFETMIVARDAMNKVLKDEMQKDGMTYQKQVDLANSWKKNSQIPDYLIEIMNENIKILNEVSSNFAMFNLIFESVIFETETKVPNSGVIQGPIIRFRLKKLSQIDNTSYGIDIGGLGNAASN